MAHHILITRIDAGDGKPPFVSVQFSRSPDDRYRCSDIGDDDTRFSGPAAEHSFWMRVYQTRKSLRLCLAGLRIR